MKNKKSKKAAKNSFHNNENRNQKWTEEPKGRVIEFADKYAVDDNSGNKFSKPQYNYSAAIKAKEKKQKKIKSALVTFLCAVLICVGYTAMDVHMIRSAYPAEHMRQNIESGNAQGDLADAVLDINARKIESVSLDSSVMLSSVIEEVTQEGYTSVTFDAKRSDGTIGYQSSLASVDTYNAISSAASKPAASVKELLDNDILPIARICCYKDNIVPVQASALAVKNGEKVYTDENANTYLNPDNEIVYGYIKDIIQECCGYGITVFVLYGCDLPEDIKGNYNGGFDSLSAKLQKDLGNSVKLFEEVDVQINGKDDASNKVTNSAIKKDIAQFAKLNKNQIYYITSKAGRDKVTDQLTANGISRYIIN